MNKFTLAAVAAIMATTVSAVGLAAPAPAKPAATRPANDGNQDRDGVVTWAEVKARADALWDRLDVNKDGKLDKADRDAALLKRFDAIDTNHDGVISKDEFLSHIHAKLAQGPWHRGPEGPGSPPPPPPHPGEPGPHGPGGPGRWAHEGGPREFGHNGFGPVGPIERLALRDARKDGVVLRADYDAAVKAHFDKLDVNHTGKLTHRELRDAFEGEHGGWHHHHHHHHHHWSDDETPPPGAR